MKKTTNYQLGLWEGTDFPNIMIPNNNMELIDNALHTNSLQYTSIYNKVTKLESDSTATNARVEEVNARVTENAEAIETLDNAISVQELNITDLMEFKVPQTIVGNDVQMSGSTVKVDIPSKVVRVYIKSEFTTDEIKTDSIYLKLCTNNGNESSSSTNNYVSRFYSITLDKSFNLEEMNSYGAVNKCRIISSNVIYDMSESGVKYLPIPLETVAVAQRGTSIDTLGVRIMGRDFKIINGTLESGYFTPLTEDLEIDKIRKKFAIVLDVAFFE